MDQRQKRIIIAVKRLIIIEPDQNAVWSDLATLTDGKDIIYNHPRLLRSLDFNDEDYESCVGDVLVELVDNRPDRLDIIVNYVKLPQWLKANDPSEYAELFGHSQLLIDQLKDRAVSNSFELNQYILRIQDVIESDPELAVGSTKELLESTMKTILEKQGQTLSGNENFPSLVRLMQKAIKLDPSEVKSTARSSDLIKRTLSNLGQLTSGINDLRRDYGTGHGRAVPSGITPRHARLAVNAGAALAVFLIETYEHHQKDAG